MPLTKREREIWKCHLCVERSVERAGPCSLFLPVCPARSGKKIQEQDALNEICGRKVGFFPIFRSLFGVLEMTGASWVDEPVQ